jgi:replicative DNA helicase
MPDSAINRELPNSIEAEQAVLATCLLNADAAHEIVYELKAENFYRMQHRLIFEAIFKMAKEGVDPDPISLADKLNSEGQLESVGGRYYIAELASNTFALTGWRRHVEIIKRMSIQRELIGAAAEINALAYDAPDDLNSVVDSAEQALFKVTEKRVSSNFERMDKLVAQAFENISRMATAGDHMVGVPSGFKDVDDLFHGFRPGELEILAARPGVGKTAFALNLATNAAKSGAAVAFFSLEMPASQLVERIICAEARVSLSKIRSGFIADSDWSAIADAANTLSKLDMHIDDTSGLSILEARAKVRRELRHVMGSDQKGLIIVDYLQLMTPPQVRRDGNRAVEVGEISRGLKIMAKEMGMPVLALSQLSRSVEQRKDKRPMLSDLRESGSIEQDADVVIFIDRSVDEAEAEDDGRPPLGTAELIVAKHRNGGLRDITLSFNPEFTKFGDYYDESRMGGY